MVKPLGTRRKLINLRNLLNAKETSHTTDDKVYFVATQKFIARCWEIFEVKYFHCFRELQLL